MLVAVETRAVTVRVPAKVNLYLAVGPARADGYHELRTVFQALDLVDEVRAQPGEGLQITLTGNETAGVPSDSRNLAWQAAELMAEQLGVAPDVQLNITKSIPVAGGMAGGSADAAGALLACAHLWGADFSRPELADLAAQLGSDVAFSLLGGTALGTGRGELLAPVMSTGTFWWAFGIADFGLATVDVYAEFDRRNVAAESPRPNVTAASPRRNVAAESPRPNVTAPAIRTADPVFDAVRAGDAHALAAAISNDLQPAALALAPQLRRTLAAGTELGALAGIVCGSGPTCAFLATDQQSAIELAAALAAEGVCRTARVASGPAPGARIVH